MIALASAQTAVGSTRITAQRSMEALAAFTRDAADFLVDNPLFLATIVLLGVIVFWVTRPRVH